MIGQQVGNYLIEDQLGQGGMGAVYRARHVLLKRPAAIKVLLPQFSVNPEIVQRFFNEARAATSVQHLGIVEVYDFGMLPNGTAYIAMELLRGQSLAQRMQATRVPLTNSLAIIRQMCGALGAAHDLGIVHRDLKPDNVYLVPDTELPSGERIKLLDFGIAKLTQEPEGMSHKTRTGALMGTPVYMAPEQCRGVAVDRRADIYSLGCILYELIAGRPPFIGEGVGDILGAHIYQRAEPITTFAPDTPPSVATLLERMLEKDPKARPQTTAAAIEAIDVLDLAPAEAARIRNQAIVANAETLPGITADAPTKPSTTLSGSAIGMLESQAPRRSRRWMVATVITIGAVGSFGAFALLRAPRNVVAPTSDAPSVAGHDAIAAAPLDAPADAPSAITIALETNPSGAHVRLDGSDVGVTPFRSTYPRRDATLVFTFSLKGFVERKLELSAMQDASRVETLELLPHEHSTHETAAHHAVSGAHPASTTGPNHPASGADSGDDDAINPLRDKLGQH